MPSRISSDILGYLDERGLLERLFREGLISHKPILMLNVRRKVDALMRQGYSHGKAVRQVAEEMNVSKMTIYRWL